MDENLLQRQLGTYIKRQYVYTTGLVRRLVNSQDVATAAANSAIAWDDRGLLLASAGDDCTIRLWNCDSASLTHKLEPGHTDPITCTNFLPGTGGRLLVSAGPSKDIRVTDLERQAVRPYSSHAASIKSLLAINGSVFASGGEDGTVRCFDSRERETSTQQSSRGLLLDQRAEAHNLSSGRISVLSMSQDPLNQQYIATGGGDALVRVYDLRMLRPPPSSVWRSYTSPPSWCYCLAPKDMRQRGASARRCQISSIAFDPSGQRLLAGYAGKEIYSFNVRQHACSYEHLTGNQRQSSTHARGQPGARTAARHSLVRRGSRSTRTGASHGQVSGSAAVPAAAASTRDSARIGAQQVQQAAAARRQGRERSAGRRLQSQQQQLAVDPAAAATGGASSVTGRRVVSASRHRTRQQTAAAASAATSALADGSSPQQNTQQPVTDTAQAEQLREQPLRRSMRRGARRQPLEAAAEGDRLPGQQQSGFNAAANPVDGDANSNPSSDEGSGSEVILAAEVRLFGPDGTLLRTTRLPLHRAPRAAAAAMLREGRLQPTAAALTAGNRHQQQPAHPEALQQQQHPDAAEVPAIAPPAVAMLQQEMLRNLQEARRAAQERQRALEELERLQQRAAALEAEQARLIRLRDRLRQQQSPAAAAAEQPAGGAAEPSAQQVYEQGHAVAAAAAAGSPTSGAILAMQELNQSTAVQQPLSGAGAGIIEQAAVDPATSPMQVDSQPAAAHAAQAASLYGEPTVSAMCLDSQPAAQQEPGSGPTEGAGSAAEAAATAMQVDSQPVTHQLLIAAASAAAGTGTAADPHMLPAQGQPETIAITTAPPAADHVGLSGDAAAHHAQFQAIAASIADSPQPHQHERHQQQQEEAEGQDSEEEPEMPGEVHSEGAGDGSGQGFSGRSGTATNTRRSRRPRRSSRTYIPDPAEHLGAGSSVDGSLEAAIERQQLARRLERRRSRRSRASNQSAAASGGEGSGSGSGRGRRNGRPGGSYMSFMGLDDGGASSVQNIADISPSVVNQSASVAAFITGQGSGRAAAAGRHRSRLYQQNQPQQDLGTEQPEGKPTSSDSEDEPPVKRACVDRPEEVEPQQTSSQQAILPFGSLLPDSFQLQRNCNVASSSAAAAGPDMTGSAASGSLVATAAGDSNPAEQQQALQRTDHVLLGPALPMPLSPSWLQHQQGQSTEPLQQQLRQPSSSAAAVAAPRTPAAVATQRSTAPAPPAPPLPPLPSWLRQQQRQQPGQSRQLGASTSAAAAIQQRIAPAPPAPPLPPPPRWLVLRRGQQRSQQQQQLDRSNTRASEHQAAPAAAAHQAVAAARQTRTAPPPPAPPLPPPGWPHHRRTQVPRAQQHQQSGAAANRTTAAAAPAAARQARVFPGAPGPPPLRLLGLQQAQLFNPAPEPNGAMDMLFGAIMQNIRQAFEAGGDEAEIEIHIPLGTMHTRTRAGDVSRQEPAANAAAAARESAGAVAGAAEAAGEGAAAMLRAELGLPRMSRAQAEKQVHKRKQQQQQQLAGGVLSEPCKDEQQQQEKAKDGMQVDAPAANRDAAEGQATGVAPYGVDELPACEQDLFSTAAADMDLGPAYQTEPQPGQHTTSEPPAAPQQQQQQSSEQQQQRLERHETHQLLQRTRRSKRKRSSTDHEAQQQQEEQHCSRAAAAATSEPPAGSDAAFVAALSGRGRSQRVHHNMQSLLGASAAAASRGDPVLPAAREPNLEVLGAVYDIAQHGSRRSSRLRSRQATLVEQQRNHQAEATAAAEDVDAAQGATTRRSRRQQAQRSGSATAAVPAAGAPGDDSSACSSDSDSEMRSLIMASGGHESMDPFESDSLSDPVTFSDVTNGEIFAARDPEQAVSEPVSNTQEAAAADSDAEMEEQDDMLGFWDMFQGQAEPAPAQPTAEDEDATARGYSCCYQGHRNTLSSRNAAWLGDRGEHVVSGSDDGCLFVWDADSGDVVAAIMGGSRSIRRVQVNPQHLLLATCGPEPVIRLWSPTADRPVDPVETATIVAAHQTVAAVEALDRRAARGGIMTFISQMTERILGSMLGAQMAGGAGAARSRTIADGTRARGMAVEAAATTASPVVAGSRLVAQHAAAAAGPARQRRLAEAAAAAAADGTGGGDEGARGDASGRQYQTRSVTAARAGAAESSDNQS